VTMNFESYFFNSYLSLYSLASWLNWQLKAGSGRRQRA